MGHLDHLGLDKAAKPGEDNVYNGALDNAAGVATTIEAAREFVESGKPPRRSVMFVAVTGEEYGLLGAGYLATNPDGACGQDRRPRRISTCRCCSTTSRTSSRSAPTIRPSPRQSPAAGVEHEGRRWSGPDARGDPVRPLRPLSVREGRRPVGVPDDRTTPMAGKRYWQRFLADTYHSVKDDLAQPIHWEAGARFADLNYRIARQHGGRRPAAHVVCGRLFRRDVSRRASPRRSADRRH